jgi:hypothetical protein
MPSFVSAHPKLIAIVAAYTALLAASCTSANSGVSSDASNGDDACGDIVGTPGGPAARECVHEVPNGGAVSFDDDGGVTVIVDGAVVATYPACPCKLSLGGGAGPPLSMLCACDAGQECISGGSCAASCSPDSGAVCPSGTTCQGTVAYCAGAACNAPTIWVCR